MMQLFSYTVNCLGKNCNEYAQISDDKMNRMGFQCNLTNLFLDICKKWIKKENEELADVSSMPPT